MPQGDFVPYLSVASLAGGLGFVLGGVIFIEFLARPIVNTISFRLFWSEYVKTFGTFVPAKQFRVSRSTPLADSVLLKYITAFGFGISHNKQLPLNYQSQSPLYEDVVHQRQLVPDELLLSVQFIFLFFFVVRFIAPLLVSATDDAAITFPPVLAPVVEPFETVVETLAVPAENFFFLWSSHRDRLFFAPAAVLTLSITQNVLKAAAAAVVPTGLSAVWKKLFPLLKSCTRDIESV